MNTISVAFLLVLAVEASSAAATGYGYGNNCTAKLDYDKCVVEQGQDHCLPGYHAWPGVPKACQCECKPYEKPVEVCCETKTVGDYSYTKVSTGAVPSSCLNNCIYTRDDRPGSKYCFAEGEQEVHCLDYGGPDYAEHTQMLTELEKAGKTLKSSELFCGSGGSFRSDIRTFKNNGLPLKGVHFHGSDDLTSIQGTYGNGALGPLHGTGTPNYGFLVNAGQNIGSISGQCVTSGDRLLVDNMIWKYRDGAVAKSAGVTKPNPHSTFHVPIPVGCTLAFISGRSGSKLDAIKFWWEC